MAEPSEITSTATESKKNEFDVEISLLSQDKFEEKIKRHIYAISEKPADLTQFEKKLVTHQPNLLNKQDPTNQFHTQSHFPTFATYD